MIQKFSFELWMSIDACCVQFRKSIVNTYCDTTFDTVRKIDFSLCLEKKCSEQGFFISLRIPGIHFYFHVLALI